MQAYRLVTKRLDRITAAERRRLNCLTLRGDGVNVSSMREDILRRETALHQIQLFLVKDTSGTIVAWSSVLPWRKRGAQKPAYIYTYVMRAHRRQGLGTRLINRAMAWCNKLQYQPWVTSWDTGSAQFFKATAQEIKVKIAKLG